MLVLCGSYIGMMETEVLGYQAPLYGRRTASTLLRLLDLPSSSLSFPHYSYEEQFLAWAVLGGMAYYLRTFSDNQNIISNTRQHIFDAQTGGLTFLPERIGGWWDRDAEIDVLVINQTEKAALVGECKWSVNLVGTNILDDLKQKSQVLTKDYGIQKVQLALFARIGFTPALEEKARVEGIQLYTVDSLVNNH